MCVCGCGWDVCVCGGGGWGVWVGCVGVCGWVGGVCGWMGGWVGGCAACIHVCACEYIYMHVYSVVCVMCVLVEWSLICLYIVRVDCQNIVCSSGCYSSSPTLLSLSLSLSLSSRPSSWCWPLWSLVSHE